MEKSNIEIFPFKLIGAEEKTFNFGYIFDLGNHWFKEGGGSKQSDRNPNSCRRISPDNIMEKFSGNFFYLNIYFDRQLNGNYGFIYKCLISEEQKGDDSVPIWKSGAQFLSQNIVYTGLTQLNAGHCVLTKFEGKNGIYKILESYVNGIKKEPVHVEESKIAIEISNFKAIEPKVKYVIYYRIASTLAWKPNELTEEEILSWQKEKRRRIVAEKNQKISDSGSEEEFVSESTEPLPSIDAPWGHQILDEDGIQESVTIEKKEITEDQKKDEKFTLFSEGEKKDWKKAISGKTKELISILRIAYIYEDGRIDMALTYDYPLSDGGGGTGGGGEGGGGDFSPDIKPIDFGELDPNLGGGVL